MCLYDSDKPKLWYYHHRVSQIANGCKEVFLFQQKAPNLNQKKKNFFSGLISPQNTFLAAVWLVCLTVGKLYAGTKIFVRAAIFSLYHCYAHDFCSASSWKWNQTLRFAYMTDALRHNKSDPELLWDLSDLLFYWSAKVVRSWGVICTQRDCWLVESKVCRSVFITASILTICSNTFSKFCRNHP